MTVQEEKQEKKQEKKQLTPAEAKRRKKRIRNGILAVLFIAVLLLAAGALGGSGNGAVMVTTVTPFVGSVEETVSTSGTVESEETKVYFASVSGRLGEVYVEAGDAVEEGELLVSYDMEAMEEMLTQAKLQYTAANSSYNGSLAGSRDAGNRLTEADTNIPVLEQQIAGSKAYLSELQDRLTTIQTDTANALAAESMNLQKKLIELQKDPVANADAIIEVQMAMQTNQYASQVAGTSEALTALQKEIAAEEERLAGYQEYKAEMEAQKQQAEAELLDSYQKENLKATEQMNALSLESVQEDYDTAQAGITAQFSGIVTEVNAVDGMTATEGVQLLTLAGSEQIKVVFSVTKYDLAKIAVGQHADVTINGRVYEGTISKINRMAEVNASGTAAVGAEIHIENPDDNIYLGLDARIELQTDRADNALLIPVEALNADKSGDFVYVEENGYAVRRSILTGISSAEYIEVKEGLAETDKVIVDSLAGSGVEEGMAVLAVDESGAVAGQSGEELSGSGNGDMEASDRTTAETASE